MSWPTLLSYYHDKFPYIKQLTKKTDFCDCYFDCHIDVSETKQLFDDNSSFGVFVLQSSPWRYKNYALRYIFICSTDGPLAWICKPVQSRILRVDNKLWS